MLVTLVSPQSHFVPEFQSQLSKRQNLSRIPIPTSDDKVQNSAQSKVKVRKLRNMALCSTGEDMFFGNLKLLPGLGYLQGY